MFASKPTGEEAKTREPSSPLKGFQSPTPVWSSLPNIYYMESSAGHVTVNPNHKRPQAEQRSLQKVSSALEETRVYTLRREPEGKGRSIFPRAAAAEIWRDWQEPLWYRLPCAGQREAAAASAHAGPGREAAPLAPPPPAPCPPHLLLRSAAISPFRCSVDCDLPLGASISSFSPAGCTRTTHNTNKPRAPPAPASLHPAAHPRRACAPPRPGAGRPHPRRGTRKRTRLAGGPRNPMGREEAQGGTGKGGEKSGASPTGGSDWLWIPAETAAPPPPPPVPPVPSPSCNNFQETKGGWASPHCSPRTSRVGVRVKWEALEGALLRSWGCSWPH